MNMFPYGPIRPGPFKPGQLVRYIAPTHKYLAYVKSTMMPTTINRWTFGVFLVEDINNTEGLLESHFGLYLLEDGIITLCHSAFEEYPLCHTIWPWMYT